MKKNIFIYLFVAYIGMMSSQAWAVRMIGTLLPDEFDDGGTSTLVEVDPTTGKIINDFGDTGYPITGTAYDESTGILFATTPSKLLSINLLGNTHTTTEIGDVGQGISITNLAVNSAGQLYSWSKAATDKLILWDKSTGTIAASGVDFGEPVHITGLAFDHADNLFLVAGRSGGPRFFKMNALTGAGTLIGKPTTGTVNAHHGDFYPGTATYYGLDAILDDDEERNILVVSVEENTIRDSSYLIPTEDFLNTITFIPTEKGECDGTSGISITDIVCVINKVLNN